ncbi:MAG TPA: DUF3137 domain-containing protein [Patescibacteria group bacterium]|nr:DUF3137 domain-containing protein [Patescibacteria group bacterium]
MLYLPHITIGLPDIFARAGGGGSSGGDGGGGGIGSAIAMIGYLPTHFVTQWLYRRSDNAWVAGIVGGIVGLIVTIPCVILNGGIGFLVGAGAVIGVYSGTHNWLGRLQKRMKGSQHQLKVAAEADPMWQTHELQARIATVYQDYQQDWSNFNLPRMQTYLMPGYYDHARLMMIALQQMGRRNVVGDPKLLKSFVVDVIDATNNSQDSFSAYVQGRARDQLIDTTTNKVLSTDNGVFEELWWFMRDENTWKLLGIRESTEDATQKLQSLDAFARNNGMYYSLDWGRLLLPKRGQLFGHASFTRSDVNNHVIGEWNGHIVQLYTYIPFKSQQQRANYLIGQIALPKSYGGIIVKRRPRFQLFNFKPRGYRKVTLEWPDFNKRYNVYATDMDKVTSFELLNPAFMAKLYDMDIKVNIEVVDNVVYLYSYVQQADHRYNAMLIILQMAFQELRL